MTQGEERRLMGDVVAELVEVRRKIGCLETKIEQYRSLLFLFYEEFPPQLVTVPFE